MPQPFLCHGHGGEFQHRRGADLYCSKECAEQYPAAQKLLEVSLQDNGFTQVKDVPNLWVKDGVHISIDQVIREGLAKALAEHQRVVAERL